MNKIIVAIDFSECSVNALLHAYTIAEHTEGELILLWVEKGASEKEKYVDKDDNQSKEVRGAFEDLVKKYPNIPKQMEEKKQIIASGKADYTDLVDLGTMHFIQENYEESLAVYEKARNEFLYQLIFKL